MAEGRKIALKNYQIRDDGKLVYVHKYHDASAKIRARKSKKVRVVKRGVKP